MPKQILAVDADDTLFDENNAVRLFMNEKYGYTHTPANYLVVGPFDNYWKHIWNLDAKQVHERYEEFCVSEYKQHMQPIAGALEVLKHLNECYDLVIVTSRDHRTVQWTHDALSKHYPGLFKDVHFTPLWDNGEKVTKAEICNEIGASYLVDDSFEHCKLAAKVGISAIVFGDYGWNRTQPLQAGMTRCNDWQSVEKQLFVQSQS